MDSDGSGLKSHCFLYQFVNLGTLLRLSEPQFTHLQNGNNNNQHLKSLCSLIKAMFAKHYQGTLPLFAKCSHYCLLLLLAMLQSQSKPEQLRETYFSKGLNYMTMPTLSAHQQMSGSKNYGIFTQWDSTHREKEGAYTL